jgi:mannose-6-phosphate isomerase-like protein (cupin superfamily)
MQSKTPMTYPEMIEALSAMNRPGVPSFFALGADLPSVGRTDTPVASSNQMSVILKCYAAGGENTLHAHPNEDHVFLVLQGRADFHGPKDEIRTVGPLEGVMLPHGTFYWFEAAEDEPLVMLRIGCLARAGSDVLARIGVDGAEMGADSKANKQVDPALSGRWFGRKPAMEGA